MKQMQSLHAGRRSMGSPAVSRPNPYQHQGRQGHGMCLASKGQCRPAAGKIMPEVNSTFTPGRSHRLHSANAAPSIPGMWMSENMAPIQRSPCRLHGTRHWPSRGLQPNSWRISAHLLTLGAGVSGGAKYPHIADQHRATSSRRGKQSTHRNNDFPFSASTFDVG
jgi:hypothetical protein